MSLETNNEHEGHEWNQDVFLTKSVGFNEELDVEE